MIKILMGKYCNNGRCPIVRAGEGWHLSHLNEKEEKPIEKFDQNKELAKIQVKATFDAAIGSVVASFGVALIVLGIAINIDSIKADEIGTYLQTLSSAYVQMGLIAFGFGLALILVKEFRINRRINKLYQKNSNE